MSTIIQSKKMLLTVALGSLIAIVLAFGSFAASAQALTSSQVDAILGLLESFGADQATMDDVEAALTGEAPSTPTPADPIVELFDRDLTTGATGGDVKGLQQWLNDNGYTVATNGAGSPGNESDYFGELTRQALAAYQAANNIEPAVGYFGPITRSAVNAEIQANRAEDDDDADDADDDATDDADEADDDDDVVAREGILTAEQRSDYRNVEVGSNQTKNVATYRMEAEDSDIKVERIDLYVTQDLMDFRGDIDHLAIKVDGDVVAETAVNRSTIGRDDTYIRFAGLNIDVEEDGYVDFTVEITASDDDTTATYNIGPDDDGDGEGAIRGVDTAGLQQYANADKISFDLTGEESGELDVSKNTNSPDEGIVVIDADKFEEVHLLSFDIEVGDSDIDLEELTVSINETITDNDGVVQDIILKEGSTDYTKAAAATVDFNTLDMELYAGETVNFEVWAEVKVTDVDEQGGYIIASVEEDENIGIAYDMTDELINLDGNATGKAQSIYIVTPLAELANSTITANAADDGAGAYMAIDVTAAGGDVYFLGDAVATIMSVVDEDASSATGAWLVSTADYSDFDAYSVATVIVDASGVLVQPTAGGVYDGTAVDTNASTTQANADAAGRTELNTVLLAWDYSAGDYVNVVDDVQTNGVYKVVASGGEAVLEATYGTDTLYQLDELDTRTVELYASRIETGWLQLEINEINWYSRDDSGEFYLKTFDKDTSDDVDALETDQVNI